MVNSLGMTDVEELKGALARCDGLLLVVTGAGISLASGIPTFRGTDKNAVWKRDVTELGTNRYFLEDPAGSWAWYLSRFDAVEGAKPNAGHHALVRLEARRASEARPFLLVTQNIDGLHAAAGSRALVEVHGSAAKVRCSSAGCELAAPTGSLLRSTVDVARFRADPVLANVPTCPKCGAWLRQHVLWFDEYYQSHRDYQWSRVLEAAERAALVLFVGTSFSVGVTDLILSAAVERGAPVYSIDPSGLAVPGVTTVAAPSETALPALVD